MTHKPKTIYQLRIHTPALEPIEINYEDVQRRDESWDALEKALAEHVNGLPEAAPIGTFNCTNDATFTVPYSQICYLERKEYIV